MACSIVAKKMNVKVAHVEGGIRSGDMSMPEEINRIVTDSITDYFLLHPNMANENLKKAGVEESYLFCRQYNDRHSTQKQEQIH